MKKVWSLILIFTALFSFCSCAKNTTNAERYGDFFDRTKYMDLHTNFDLFPESLPEDCTVNQYQFYFKEGLFFTDAIVLLDLTCTTEVYNREIERISQTKYSYMYGDVPIIDLDHFHYTAYVHAYATEEYDYVLTIPEENRLVFVFSQTAPKGKFKCSEDLLPKEYSVGITPDHYRS